MWEGHAPGPAGPPEYDHCGEKQAVAQQSSRAPEGGPAPCPDQFGHSRPTFLAPGAGTSWWAAAPVPVDLIYTRGSVSTGRGLALIDVCRESGYVFLGAGWRPHTGTRTRERQDGAHTSGHLTHSDLGRDSCCRCHSARLKPSDPRALPHPPPPTSAFHSLRAAAAVRGEHEHSTP